MAGALTFGGKIVTSVLHEQEVKTALTAAELQVITALSHGTGIMGAAEIWGKSFEATKDHVKRARRKMGAKTTEQLVAECFRKGLIK